MVTVKRVPDVFEQKNYLAQVEEKKATYEFVQKCDPEFLNYDTLAFGQKDFSLEKGKRRAPEIENVHGLTVFDKRPKAIWEKEYARFEKKKEADGLAGKQPWVRNHVLPNT